MSAIIGVDVGGTFTDLFLFEAVSGAFRIAKVPSQRGDEATGFLQGLSALGDVAAFGAIVHGTTVGTNALLERKGCRLGVITTQGFRDVLEMRRRDRPRAWGLWGNFTPIAERAFRREVPERTLADGSIHTPVDLDAVREAAAALLAEGAEAVALVFINSYANPANERAAAEVLRAAWPNAHVSVSSEILPEIREFERASTTALNAYLQPKVADYLERLEGALARRHFAGRFHIVQSNGGIMSTARARATPARTALSGPAAGVIAAAAIARAAGFANVITGDLGGTSFDVSLVVEGEMALAAQTTVDFGLVIRSPMIEITTIGAGGGSIARVDAGGLLQVGPESAGSRPGPVCYGQGNTRPTLTDANLVLGRINAARPIGGALARLDLEAAEAAILEHVGTPLSLDAASAAEAIIRVANARMAGAIRLVSIERGHDPGEFALLPFGGGGALHVGALLRDVGLRAALVPRFPGITSAMGCVLADVRHDATRTLNLDLQGLDANALSRHLSDAAAATRSVVEDAGLPLTGIESVFELDMHYVGQTHTVAVPLPGAEVTEAIIRTAFEATYGRAFSRLLPGIGVRILGSRVTAIGRRPAFDMAALAPPATGRTTPIEERQVRFDGAWWPTPVYARLELPAGHVVQGPALLEQADTTILVEPGLSARTDTLGNLILERA
ncbi:hydantoinase/oxoprolinase family protein [Sediminicoccus rosea]|jgi:N-methylhydantoinase A|uniref:Hydantoinase/oxoprolinase family protein n=1 Tax=Sediminicoccus rosea TaxID=1225128 RepID=A0ABZ0PDW0_9PROT|nr:hydantoinase/oxoprolinase family protein [Sediminicoccus rosea]WPB83792.1 hydantoinase/oxoprolinase family protein [Sediminicoccus rosea]